MRKNPIQAAVIGHPIAHSKSPAIHNYWIQKYGLQGQYMAIDIAPENLRACVNELADAGYAGFNVTVPHKVSIFDICTQVDETARQIGAVNTVVLRDGEISGTNTDAFGFMENLKSTRPVFYKDRPAVVLGAGGAARAIVYALLQEGFQNIIITNRTDEKAKLLCDMSAQTMTPVDWDMRESALKNAGLLVNTTSSGMSGKDPLVMDLKHLPADALVSDIVYAPLMTDLLKNAQGRGNPIVTGIGMLLHQARPAFQKWFGVLPDVDTDLQKRVLA
jgi:shikimate dehydrogenase